MKLFSCLRSISLLSSFALGVCAQSPAYNFTTLTGLPLLGSADGPGSTAGFAAPNDVAVDQGGNLYVADSYNHTIRKISPTGVVSTLAGLVGSPGSADGDGSAARFRFPEGVAVDADGSVYVADAQNQTIRKITPAGAVSTLAGQAGTAGSADGHGSAARFNFPAKVAVDRSGNVYVGEGLNRTIRKITSAGDVSTLAGQVGSTDGGVDGTGSAARFAQPAGVAVDGAGNVFVSDVIGTIRRITAAGEVTTIAGTSSAAGSGDGTGPSARFRNPNGLAVDKDGNVYVADNSNSTIRKISPTREVTTLAGLAEHPGTIDGSGAAARFDSPGGVTVDDAGNVYVADTGNALIRQITPAGAVTTKAGRTGSEGNADGAGSAARFSFPEYVAVDLAGSVYASDLGNHTIRKITPAGVATTFAGVAGQTGSSDGPGGAARFNGPSGIAVDEAGNVYVADSDNFTIRKITAAGVVSTLAGRAGDPGSDDGLGQDARFMNPAGLAVDRLANIYVADHLAHTIRKITPEGVVSTLAGQAGSAGITDGTGGQAHFSFPEGVALDRDGNVYVTDNTATIRKITPAGAVSTLAGKSGNHAYIDGPGSDARFFLAGGIAVDRAGTIYVADFHNTIRRVSPAGVVSTLAGEADAYGGADGADRAARFYFPDGVALDLAGNLYVADSGNNTIRKAVSTTRLVNLSVRTRVGTGDQTPFVGFFLNGPKNLLIRGIGPTLLPMGVTDATVDPQLTLFDFLVQPIQENDNWGGSAQLRQAFVALGAFPLDAGSRDAASLATLDPGLYSARLAAAGGAGGVALLETYDADMSTTSRLTNMSVRSFAGTGDNTLIGGFVLAGSAPKTVLIRGAGPSLVRHGLEACGVLADPKLTLFKGTTIIDANDNWGGTLELKEAGRSVDAFEFDSDTSKDAALLVTLQPGIYTVHATGADAGTGVALIEIYELP